MSSAGAGKIKTKGELLQEISRLRARMQEGEEALEAIRRGDVDALVVSSAAGDQIFTLQGAEHPYRVMVETMNEGAATLLEDGTLLYANPRMAELLDEPLGTLIGSSIWTFIPREERDAFEELMRQGLNESRRGETHFRCQSPNMIPALVSFSPTLVEGTRAVCLVATDLTEQKRGEEIVAAERLARSILEQAAEAILVCDTHAKIIRANQKALQIFSKNLLYRHFDRALPLTYPDPQRREFSILKVLNGESFQSIETEYHAGPDEDCFLLLGAAPLYKDQNQIIGCIITLTEITERKRLENRLEQSNKDLERRVHERTQDLESSVEKLSQEIAENIRIHHALQESETRLREALKLEHAMRSQLIQAEKNAALARLVASVAHELNNPIQTILNSVYLARVDIPAGSASEKILEIAVGESQRVARLVAQLRETYRPNLSSQMERFNLLDVLHSVQNFLEPHLRQNHSRLILAAPDRPVWVNGLADQIKQVCLNISLNAIEAMQPDGGPLEVTVTLPEDGRVAAVAFKDEGPGILPDIQDRLFEPFFTTKPKGTGLGLAICYEIIRDHHGSIQLSSQPGHGAVFTVCLPLGEEPEP